MFDAGERVIYVLNHLLDTTSSGRAWLIDNLLSIEAGPVGSSKWDRRRLYGPAHLLDSSTSRWDRARSPDNQ